MLKCHLINLQTKEVVKAKSAADFCRITGMDDYRDVIHVYPILRGERLHFRGWATLDTFKKHLSLKDIYGNEYKGRIGELLFDYGIPANRIWALMTGKRKVFQGLSLSDTEYNFIPPNPYKILEYQFITPNNKVICGDSYRKVANKVNNAVSYHSLNELLRGKTTSVKGYKFLGAKLIKKTILDSLPDRPVVFVKGNRRDA